MTKTSLYGQIVLLLVCCPAADGNTGDDLFDWPNWRGPQQNRISAETGLVDRWNPKGGVDSNLLWKNADLAGRSTPVVLGDKLYTIVRDQSGTHTEGEKVVCASTATGEILWQHRFNVYLSDVPDTRVGWSSCVVDPETGNVYALGVCGYFCCLNGKNGELIWSRSLHEEFGLLSTYGGRTNIPKLYRDTVIISAVVIGWGDTPQWGLLAKPAHRFLAFDKTNGELRWLKGTRLIPYDTTYSTSTITSLSGLGMDAMVFGSGDGQIWALQPGTGLPIWWYPFSRRGLNISPLVTPAGRVFSSHSEENVVGNTMGSIVVLDGNQTGDLSGQEQWRHFEIMAGKSSPLMIGERIYFVDDRAKLFIFDANSGELVQRKALGTVMRSTPLFADGKIYLCTNNGRWYILEPTEQGVKVIHKLRLKGEASDGSPIVSHGRIYLPTSEYLYCIGKPDHQPTSEVTVASSAKPPIHARDNKPAHLQVVPYDVLLKPGDQQTYSVRLYNGRGEYLRDAATNELAFSIDGPGQIGPDGSYAAPTDAGHQCSLITCRLGELKGSARVRIVPPLPWSFDFDDLDDVPLTWVGGRVRYVLSDWGEQRVMVKRSELPTRPGAPTTKLGTRSRMWMGPINLSNYTIEADVRLPTNEAGNSQGSLSELPQEIAAGAIRQGDLGLINSRYTFALYGASQEVRLYSWCTHDKRAQAAQACEINPDTWYRLKMRVKPRGHEALVQGKVWPRDAKEPDDWTLEFVDPAPNLNGSPGLFGNAKDAEILLDNILVTPN